MGWDEPGPDERVLTDRERGRDGRGGKNKLEKDFTAGQAGAQRCCARTRRVARAGGEPGPDKRLMTIGREDEMEGRRRVAAKSPLGEAGRGEGADRRGSARIDGARIVAGLVGAAGDGGD